MATVSEVPADQVILATGGYDHSIRFWAAYNGQCQRTLQHQESQVNAMEITPDRRLLAVAGFQHIRMYDIPGGGSNQNPISTYEGIGKNVTGIGFNDDTRWMYSSGEDGTVRIWDLRVRNTPQKLSLSSCPVNCVTLHPNQIELLAGDQDGKIHVWDIRSERKEIHTADQDVSIQFISIEPEGNWLSAVDNKGNCYVYRLKSHDHDMASPSQRTTCLKKRLKLPAHRKYALKCKFSPDSTLLVTTSADATAKVWRTADLLPLSQDLDLSADPASVSLSGSIGNTGAWPSSENVSPLVILKSPTQRWVWDVAFSMDSQYMITASSDNNARLWNINTGECIREYSGHQKAITALAFSDGIAAA